MAAVTQLDHLKMLEAESIYILREAAAEFARPVMLYSIGKDSSVMLRLAQKAFYPGKIPFPLLHIDTSYKFPEMIEFRDCYAQARRRELIVHKNQKALDDGANPFALGTQKCCGLLKTKSLLDALAEGGFDCGVWRRAPRRGKIARQGTRLFLPRFARAVGPEKSAARAVEHFQFAASTRAKAFACFRSRTGPKLDVWLYIHAEKIPIVPLYFAKEREVVVRGEQIRAASGRRASCCPARRRSCVKCRMRSLGCVPCTGAIRSDADTVPKIIEEMISFRRSERENRVIDHDEEGSMEIKKREGYF